MIQRRDFVLGSLAVVTGVAAPRTTSSAESSASSAKGLYGLIGKVTAKPGQRDALVALLIEASLDLPGCRHYVIAQDAVDVDGIWITEVWDNEQAHAASLSLPNVRGAIAKGRPLIAGFGERHVTTPIGGQGLGVED